MPDDRCLLTQRIGGRVMKKNLITLALGATVAIGAVASPTAADARWHHGFPVAPIVGGLSLALRLRHQDLPVRTRLFRTAMLHSS